MSDGDIDYFKFTLLELEEALAGINRQRYPKNYENLRSTYEQRIAAMVVPVPPAAATATDSAARQEPAADWWNKLWGSRPVAALVAVAFLWWAYDLFSNTGTCPSGGKLMGDLVKAACENFGQTAAAGIPFFIGLVWVVLAIRPRRRSGT
jgi:hypothetical protein